jgi:tripartite-type tricarboxylate transporter receptor subunit TctC
MSPSRCPSLTTRSRPARARVASVLGAVGLLACLAAGGAYAQAFPTKPIRIVVPFPPGGGTDVVVRTVAPHMAEVLGQQIIVDNRAGAGGNIGTDAVAKSPADGYTLLAASAATAINTTLSKNVTWSATRDFAPVVLLVVNQSLLVVHPTVAAKNVRELLALAKSRPGKLTFASYGNGSSAHLVGELFKMSAGVDLVHVPYKGAAPAVGDLLGGQVDMLFADVAAVLPHVRSGKLVPLGIGSAKRFNGLPDVPTIAESGVPGFEGGGFIGLVAPAGTPKPIVDALNAAALKSLATNDVRDRLNGLASPPVGESPEYFTKFIRTETEKWAKVIASGKITAE